MSEIIKSTNWTEINKRYLMASIKLVGEELNFYSKEQKNTDTFKASLDISNALNKLREEIPAKPAIDILCDTFGLSPFERKIILICIGVEIHSDFGNFIGKLKGQNGLVHPTFNLAMTYLSEEHWDAISPASVLRKWNLINITNASVLAKSKLQIDEPILHFLLGGHYLDERLSSIFSPCSEDIPLLKSQEILYQHISSRVKSFSQNKPVIQFEGEENVDQIAIAARVAKDLKQNLYRLSVHAIPNQIDEIKRLAKFWNRKALLNNCALFIDCSDLGNQDITVTQSIVIFIDSIQGVLFMEQRDWTSRLNRPNLSFKLTKPTHKEQLDYWAETIKKMKLPVPLQLSQITTHFNLSARNILDISKEVANNIPQSDYQIARDKLQNLIWERCCKFTRPKVTTLAQHLNPVAKWDDLVLPESQMETLNEIIQQVKNREKVYNEWGFQGKSARGFGISALFTGESGTGKTMAAEVIANALHLDLYQIDLSQLINKYVGETEKNIKKVFDAAENSSAILLINEADSLFGKRGEANDSQGHYINLKIGYLLQRMEDYKGLAILTTNLKHAIDGAFLRRIRFIIHFSNPNKEHRAEIWKAIFPREAKKGQLEFDKLAQLNLSGGTIKNVAMNAAFLAAGANEHIEMSHILKATKSEYKKLEKTLSKSEIKDWDEV